MLETVGRNVESVRHIRPDAFVVRVERKGMAFVPGQHVTLGLEGAGINREYSIYSGADDPYVEFLVKTHAGSDSAEALGAAAPGDAVTLAGPYGAFTLPCPVPFGTPVWFVAGGVGIAPFHSIVRSVPGLDYHVLHGVREVADAYGREDYAEDRHITCCSRVPDGDFHGRVTDWLVANRLPPNALVFVCGPANMVADTYECLRVQGLSSDRLFTEVFF
jgi:ferredoxin-NADP reductase